MPVFALIVITLIALLFVVIGKVNTLGPIVTMPFMLTYAAVDYAYFVLAMSYEQKHKRRERLEGGQITQLLQPNGSASAAAAGYGAIPVISRGKCDDLDTLFPERTQYDRHHHVSPSKKKHTAAAAATSSYKSSQIPAPADAGSPTFVAEGVTRDGSQVATGESSDTAELIASNEGTLALLQMS